MSAATNAWLDDAVDQGIVSPPGRPNQQARDALLEAARTSLADATCDPNRSPGGIIRDTENAVRQAISALAAHHGTRFVGPNKHAAVVRFAELHPDFDSNSVEWIDRIRVARNAGMYGERHEATPVDYTAAEAARLLETGTSVVNRVTTLLNARRPIPPPPPT